MKHVYSFKEREQSSCGIVRYRKDESIPCVHKVSLKMYADQAKGFAEKFGYVYGTHDLKSNLISYVVKFGLFT